MNVRFQKVSAFILVLALCTGLLTVPASATESSSISNMWDTFFQTTSPIYSLIKNFLPDGVSPEKATSAQKKDAYKQYVTNIQNNISTTIVGSGGYPLLFTPDFDSYAYSDKAQFSYSNLQVSSDLITVDFELYNKSVFQDRILLPLKLQVPSISGTYSFNQRHIKDDSLSDLQCQLLSGRDIASASLGNLGYLYDSSGNEVGYWGRQGGEYISAAQSPAVFSFKPRSFGEWVTAYPAISLYLKATSQAASYHLVMPRDYVWFVPSGYSVDGFTQNIGGNDSRLGKYSGDFGYYGDNGELIVADNVQIVNEGDKTIYNPVTGETSTITDWTYNYDNRTYELTLDTGDKITVTYGDENVTINQGDTIFNIYYIVPGGGDPTPTPSPSPSSNPDVCKHKYTSKVTTEPGCTSVGITTFTCSLCGDAYTEKIPATGHSWVVDRVVEDTKDEEGKVTSKGYTVYKCSVCGQEYKDAEGTGPPEEEEKEGFLSWLLGKVGELLGSIGEGIVNLLKTALGKILDGLIAIVDMLAAKLSEVLDVLFRVFDEIPKMFEGFTEFLGGMFSFLPPEVTTIIIFGILAIVLVAIIKMFLK